MRKRLVLVVGAIALGGIGLAVPAIAGAVGGNGPAVAPVVTSPAGVPVETSPAPPVVTTPAGS
jgi:hypothetical protein